MKLIFLFVLLPLYVVSIIYVTRTALRDRYYDSETRK